MLSNLRLPSAAVLAIMATTAAAAQSTVSNTILVFARDTASAYSATSGLQGYGIPYETVIVPQTGITLPSLNTSASQGNYGGIIVLSEVSYDFGNDTWSSALTTTQWTQLYDYQTTFGVRMVRLDVYPGPAFGAETAIAGAGCCDTGVEQLISFSDDSAFKTAGIRDGASITTAGLWHYPAVITNSTIATEIAQFAPASIFNQSTTAAVINNIEGREQMVWFTSWATEWSITSNFLQHSYIHWITRGLFVGYRRTYFGTQIDDMHLSTEMYSPNGTEFRLRPEDLEAHVTWTANVNSRLPSGSLYFVEIGHNGNGDIEASVAANNANCNPAEAIEYAEQIDTPLEFQKPLGTGDNIWPATPLNYTWSLDCAKGDELATWFMNATNRDAFAHISHTFTHASLNNATYSDTWKEIQFNVNWLNQVGISAGKWFSPSGLIPPAITGLHNGDAIRAWIEQGIIYVVGDNTRPVLMNSQNEFWPLTSTVEGNGYAGLTIIPRWATTIYYNCDLADCTTKEWIDTSGGNGDFTTLLDDARLTNVRHLLSLHHDPFMFHQANLRQADVEERTIGSVSGKLSLLQIWVETVLQEFTRLTTWPVITLTHDELGVLFNNRVTRDNCKPNLAYIYSDDRKTITGVTVTATGNTCSTPIAVTFPGGATTTASGTTKDKVGDDSLIVWVTLSGSPVTFTLDEPLSV